MNKNIIYRTGDPLINPALIKPTEGIIEGIPIVFNQRTNIGGFFYEEIDPHALDDADLSDILLLLNHNDSMIPLARHRRGSRSTMDIKITPGGLHITARTDIAKNTDAARLCSAVERGDIEGMSFAFGITVEGDEWREIDAEMPIRRITKISKVYEVSAVNNAAYPQTSISSRAATLDNEKRALDNARAAMLDNRKREAEKALTLEKQKFLFKNGGNLK